jgi:hypothetical protein
MMDWQRIIREATKEAASAKWRDYALTRLPEVPGWSLSKPRGFGGGSEAVYAGQTKGGIQLKVTVDKGKGVWRAEAGGLVVEDDIAGLDAGAVQHALGEAAEAMDQHIESARRRPKVAARDFASPGVRRLSGSLHDIRQRADVVLDSLDAMLDEEDGRNVTLDEARQAAGTGGHPVGYHLDMIEQATGAFRYR